LLWTSRSPTVDDPYRADLPHEIGIAGRASAAQGLADSRNRQRQAYDLAELFTERSRGHESPFGASAYIEADVAAGNGLEVRPGVEVVLSPRAGIEPRLRAEWSSIAGTTGTLHAALGVHRQNVVGTSDIRDVSSVFVAWLSAPDGLPLDAVQGTLGWQHEFGPVRWSVEGYYKRLKGIPVPVWTGVAQFTTRLGRADGDVYGADARLEYTSPRFYGFLGYGYGRTTYEAAQSEFSTWFGEPVLSYHPPHDRRHQVNAIANLEVADFTVSARWQYGSGLPFTRPLGFDESFDFTRRLHDVHRSVGTTRILLDRPFTGRLPAIHRLDVSVERSFDLSFGTLRLQAGVINGYDRRNIFYYDLFSGRRLDQLPIAPFAAVSLRSR
jgi:hypothetical protein